MLTLQDCLGLSELADHEELFLVAHHEHLPDIVALEKAHTFLEKDWGAPAVRQMVMDEVRASLAGRDCEQARAALHRLERSFAAHPGGHDRRLRRHHDEAAHAHPAE